MSKPSRHRILFDLEATCWEDKEFQERESEIIEIGAVRFDYKTYDVIDSFKVLVKPLKQPTLSEYCINLTGITQEELDRDAFDFPTAYNSFMGWAGSTPMFMGWGAYDYHEIAETCKRYNMQPFPPRKYMNAKLLYTFLTGIRGGGLGKRMVADGLEFEGRQHRALDDSINTLRLLRNAAFS